MSNTVVLPAGSSIIHRFVAAGHLRYWIITSWALALATEVALPLAGAWFAGTMSMGLLRAWVESRTPRASKAILTAVATVSCIAWAIAPLLAWFWGGGFGPLLAAVLLCAGYFLVFTQMRAAPREALIVSAPYGMVAAVCILSLWGDLGFWTLAAATPVLFMSLLIKVLITQLKDGELQAVVAEQQRLITDLELARDEADAANKAKSNFLGVISHELRTPMNGVLGAAQLLGQGDLPEREKRYVEIIRNSGENLLQLLNDLLDMTRIEAGRLELHPQVIACDGLVDRIVGPCASQAEAKGLTLRISSSPADLPVAMHGDPVRISQVVQNLVSNAIKFTEAGTVLLRMAIEPADGERLKMIFTVSDTGTGISEEDMGRLFQPFNQLDNSTTRRFGGTGLGLTIARRLARAMGGDITVQSRLGHGSTFTFTALVDPVQAKSPAPVMANSDPSARRLNVLVVEDHPLNRTVLQAWLGAQGHASSLAADGEEALVVASQAGFDLILMDVNMPVMDGLSATKRLRSRAGPNRETPVVVVSASARPEDLHIGISAGADAYLTKPIDFARLAETLYGLENLRSERRTSVRD